MSDPTPLSNYRIASVYVENQRVCAYDCLTASEESVTVNRIRDKDLIKYYLKHLHKLAELVPVETYFVAESDLFIVIKTEAAISPLDADRLTAGVKLNAFDQLFAKLAHVEGLPYFIMSSLVQFNNLGINSNDRMVFRGLLTRQNPDRYESIDYLQHQIGGLLEAAMTEEMLSENHRHFIRQCEASEFTSMKALFIRFRTLLASDQIPEEPFIYQQLFKGYQWLGTHRKKLIVSLIVLLMISFGISTLSDKGIIPQPYQKLQIGLISYADPYTDTPTDNKIYQINAIEDIAPIEETPVEVPETPAYEIYIVNAGDYLNKIASAYYGVTDIVPALAAYNHLEDPNLLPIGFPLKLPPLEQLQARVTE
jgi:LysM repeat protein